MKQRVPLLLLLVLLAAAFILPTSVRSAPPAQSPAPSPAGGGLGRGSAPVLIDRAGGSYNGVEVTLEADAAPTPGGVVTLTLTARPLRAAPDLTVQWELPDGGTLLNGPMVESLGPVAAGQSATITRRVRFDDAAVDAEDGIYEVRAKASYLSLIHI